MDDIANKQLGGNPFSPLQSKGKANTPSRLSVGGGSDINLNPGEGIGGGESPDGSKRSGQRVSIKVH